LAQFLQLQPAGAAEFYRGMAYRALGNHQEARGAFSKAVATGYQGPYVFYELIEQDRAEGDKQAGLRDFVNFSQRFPDSPWLHVLLGDAHLLREENSAAQAEYQQALSQDPSIPVVHFKLGYMALKLAQYSEAVDHFRREIAADPGFSEAYLYLGAALHRLGRTTEAIPILQQAITHEPTTALAYRELAVAQMSTGQTEAAERTLREGVERHSKEAALHAQLARLLTQSGRDSEARKEASLAESLSRQNEPRRTEKESETTDATQELETLANEEPAARKESQSANADALGDARQCLDRRDGECAAKALAQVGDPALKNSADYLELKARVLALQNRKPEALEAIGFAIQREPAQARYVITQGSLQQQFGDQVSAIKSYLAAQKLDPNSPVPLYLIGMSFCTLGVYYNQDDYYKRAERHFEAALKLDPKYDRAEFMLAVVDEFLSRTDESRRHFQHVLEMNPESPYYHLHYGILMNRLGDDVGALREMKLAERLDSSYALTHLNLGSLYARMKNYTEARAQLEAAVRLNANLSSAYYLLGSVYHHLSLDDKSRSAFEQFQKTKAAERNQPVDPAERLISSPTP
jgi:tetratricopeptide (TPR) repeat protein